MPPRHHRTVDRIVAILEMAARSRRGLTLADIASRLDAPKSSIHELINGLLATGYLIESDRGFGLGPAPFVLSLTGNRVAAQEIDHELLVKVHKHVKCSVLIGVQVGDSLVYIDHVGDDPALQFTARNHSHRSLYATASGKILLANLPVREMDAFLLAARPDEKPAVEQFLRELPEIRRTGLAYNLAGTVSDVYSVATALRRSSGEFIGAVCAIGRQDLESKLPKIGRAIQKVLEVAY
jgi:DNA-binding IclR family transcriptional regulator